MKSFELCSRPTVPSATMKQWCYYTSSVGGLCENEKRVILTYAGLTLNTSLAAYIIYFPTYVPGFCSQTATRNTTFILFGPSKKRYGVHEVNTTPKLVLWATY